MKREREEEEEQEQGERSKRVGRFQELFFSIFRGIG
jgi:hypothetical protein